MFTGEVSIRDIEKTMIFLILHFKKVLEKNQTVQSSLVPIINTLRC